MRKIRFNPLCFERDAEAFGIICAESATLAELELDPVAVAYVTEEQYAEIENIQSAMCLTVAVVLDVA